MRKRGGLAKGNRNKEWAWSEKEIERGKLREIGRGNEDWVRKREGGRNGDGLRRERNGERVGGGQAKGNKKGEWDG